MSVRQDVNGIEKFKGHLRSLLLMCGGARDVTVNETVKLRRSQSRLKLERRAKGRLSYGERGRGRLIAILFTMSHVGR